MPLAIFRNLDLGNLVLMKMQLLMADKTIKKPMGILYDVLVNENKFMLPADFVILGYKVDFAVPIILGRPFLATG